MIRGSILLSFVVVVVLILMIPQHHYSSAQSRNTPRGTLVTMERPPIGTIRGDVEISIVLDGPSVASVVAAAPANAEKLPVYLAAIAQVYSSQQAVVAELKALGARIQGRSLLVQNSLLVVIDASLLANIQALAGVVNVQRPPNLENNRAPSMEQEVIVSTPDTSR